MSEPSEPMRKLRRLLDRRNKLTLGLGRVQKKLKAFYEEFGQAHRAVGHSRRYFPAARPLVSVNGRLEPRSDPLVVVVEDDQP